MPTDPHAAGPEPTYTLRRWRWSESGPGLALTRSAVRCYRQVFGNDPVWRAGRWCAPCSTPEVEVRFRFDQAPDHCPRCARPLTDRWPVAYLMDKFQGDLNRPGVAFVACSGDEVVGLCTAVIAVGTELIDYLELPGPLAGRLSDRLGPNTSVAYLDLSCVLAAHQGRGVGRRLNEQRLAWLRSRPSPPPWLLVRTSRDTTVLMAWRLRHGFEVAVEYADYLDRVLLVRALTPPGD